MAKSIIIHSDQNINSMAEAQTGFETILEQLIDGTKALEIQKQEYCVDGYYQEKRVKTHIWFKFFPEVQSIVTKEFKIFGNSFKLNNVYMDTDHLPIGEIFDTVLQLILNEVENEWTDQQCQPASAGQNRG